MVVSYQNIEKQNAPEIHLVRAIGTAVSMASMWSRYPIFIAGGTSASV